MGMNEDPAEYPSLEEELANAELNELAELDAQERFGPTPWQVICPIHGRVSLSRSEYERQMAHADALWKCHCGASAQWDDDNYEHHYPEYPGSPHHSDLNTEA